MSTYPDTVTGVAAGVSAYANAEQSVQTGHDALMLLPDVYEAIRAAGLIGYLECLERQSNARRLAGMLAAVENEIAASHQKDTARAKELSIDLPPPGGIHTDGGGR